MPYGSVGNWQTTLTQNQGCCGFESHSSYSFGDWLTVDHLALNQTVKVRILLPELVPMV